MALLVIEIDTPTNGDYHFAPVMEKVRGRFDARRVRLESAYKLLMDLPDGVPGQRIELDEARGLGAFVEPLRDPAHAATLAAVEKLCRGMASPLSPGGAAASAVPEARREFPNVHAPTWAYWMKRAVEAGQAKLVGGRFADGYPDAKKSLYWTPSADPRDAQVSRLENTVSKLAALLLAGLPVERRKEVERALAGS